MKKNKGIKIKKIFKYVTIGLALILVYFYVGLTEKTEDMEWGVTFSPFAAEGLGLYWPEVYQSILDDLKVNNLRLVAYWNTVEPEDDKFDFRSLDYLIQEAARREVKIILAVGRRLPRWPECHEPTWVRNQKSSARERTKNQELLEYIKEVVLRYKAVPNITMWQLENEFFLRGFGECPKAEAKFLDEELKLVRSLDTRPILLTDSGELGGWFGSLRRADVFGTTMYRIVYNPMFGYAKYPLRPLYYKRRFLLYKPFVRAKRIINMELQAEPWAQTVLTSDPLEVQYRSMNPQQFQSNLEYAKASGISPAYLWGVEWWYYMKEVKGKKEIWEIAKKLWSE